MLTGALGRAAGRQGRRRARVGDRRQAAGGGKGAGSAGALACTPTPCTLPPAQMGIFRKGFKAMFERGKWKVLRGDKVVVTAGKDAGQVGTVLKVLRDQRFPRVVVEGLNLVSS